MAKQLLAKEVTAAMIEKLQARVAALKEKGVTPTLGIIRCGENPSDLSYERGATKRAEEIGVAVEKFVLPEDITKEALIAKIEEINENDAIHGVLMFRPLPKHLKADQDEICNHLKASKDIDCMTDLSNAGVFMGKNATVTVCHTKTVNTAEICKNADIIVSAAGVLNSLTADYVRPGQVVIDVSINWDENKPNAKGGKGAIAGDAKFDEVAAIVDAITPVPGGVGSVTTSVLMKHVVEAAERA